MLFFRIVSWPCRFFSIFTVLFFFDFLVDSECASVCNSSINPIIDFPSLPLTFATILRKTSLLLPIEIEYPPRVTEAQIHYDYYSGIAFANFTEGKDYGTAYLRRYDLVGVDNCIFSFHSRIRNI